MICNVFKDLMCCFSHQQNQEKAANQNSLSEYSSGYDPIGAFDNSSNRIITSLQQMVTAINCCTIKIPCCYSSISSCWGCAQLCACCRYPHLPERQDLQ